MKNLLSIVIVIFLVSCERRLEFDKNCWKNYPNERYKMADNIVKTKLLIGKDKQDVRVLLTEDCKYCDDTSNNWMYYLGEGFNKLDRKWEILDVEFQDGKVVSVSVR